MKLKELDQIDRYRALLDATAPEVVLQLTTEIRRLRLALMDIRDPSPSQKWQADKIDAALSE